MMMHSNCIIYCKSDCLLCTVNKIYNKYFNTKSSGVHLLCDDAPVCFLFQLSVSHIHLQQCVTQLSSSVMGQERRSFLLHSHFYERILQQQTQLLYQREQVRVEASASTSRTPFKNE